MEEIKSALFQMGPLKAPGPDEVHALFFQSQWETVGESICKFIRGMFDGDPIPADLNRTLIVLIPKVEKPEHITQFRPISLYNVIQKLISKVVVNHLKNIMSSVVSPNQVSFVPGSHITDNIILAQEIVHTMRRKTGKKGFMMIKIDLEKAYDKLPPFIFNCCFKLNFLFLFI